MKNMWLSNLTLTLVIYAISIRTEKAINVSYCSYNFPSSDKLHINMSVPSKMRILMMVRFVYVCIQETYSIFTINSEQYYLKLHLSNNHQTSLFNNFSMVVNQMLKVFEDHFCFNKSDHSPFVTT